MIDAANNTDDFVSFQSFLKATPVEESGERFIYIEASNEGIDLQGEKVLSEALADSKDYYLRYGNIDIDHFSIIGAKAGIQNPLQYEIGRPVDVRIENRHTFVKAQLYKGDSELAKNANMVWESMTKISPPKRWYPSVGGSAPVKVQEFDPESCSKVTVVKSVRWTNIGLSQTPVNQHVPTASASPIGTFCKSLNAFTLNKALEASYATDATAMTGGAAFGMQSLDTGIHSYFDFRERISEAIRGRKVGRDITNYAIRTFGLSHEQASDWVERFLRGIKQSAATSIHFKERSK
ncbi:MAG TPA: hypothetical protein PKZ37_14830 [Gallionellaceae bacterium]|jgi:hypothetical protein|nr:hypothetical protein [Gallionellaceae bacterium]